MIGPLILILFGLLFIVWGILFLDEKRYRKFVVWTAERKGVKPEITKNTYKAGKQMCVVYVILGILLILIGVWLNTIINGMG